MPLRAGFGNNGGSRSAVSSFKFIHTSYTLVLRFIGDGPHIAAGSPARHANSFQAPKLLFHGTSDLNVSVRQSRRIAARLEAASREVTYREFEGLDHSLNSAEACRNAHDYWALSGREAAAGMIWLSYTARSMRMRRFPAGLSGTLFELSGFFWLQPAFGGRALPLRAKLPLAPSTDCTSSTKHTKKGGPSGPPL